MPMEREKGCGAEFTKLNFKQKYMGPIYTCVNERYVHIFEEGEWRLPPTVGIRELGTRLKAKSSHGVFATLSGTKGIRNPKIVVKPYSVKESKVTKIEQEFSNTIAAYEKGLSKVEPLAIMIDGENEVGWLYTIAKSRSVPLSRVKYEVIDKSKRIALIQEVGSLLRTWHDNNFVHNDAKLKNVLYHTSSSAIKFSESELDMGDEAKGLLDLGEQEELPEGIGTRMDAIDLENSRFLERAPNHEEKGYDLATMAGDAIHHGLIRNKTELRMFLKSYDKHDVQKWMSELKARISVHGNDKNIQNLSKILGE